MKEITDIMKTVPGETVQLPVMEHFYTMQGEGVHTGQGRLFYKAWRL